MKMLKNKKVLFISIVAILLVSIIGISYSLELFNNELIVQNTDLTYYLDIYYDGVDKDGVKSSDTKTINVNSEYMIVEDKIPEGLTFKGFVTTSDGSIGATKRNSEAACIGSVYDDTKEEKVNGGTWNDDNTEYYYHGLHYNVETKTVSFKVKNLQAGCKLTVGIITRVPGSVDNPNTPDVIEKRKDFYNIATVRDNMLTKLSNILHAYMGKNGLTTYNVNYSYTGNVPANAPALPNNLSYINGDLVGVIIPVNIEGYTFSGWETEDVEVVDGTFTMPKQNVNFTGSYTELQKSKVKYVISGTTPSGYVVPTEKEYYQDNSVRIDSLKKDDVFNGYKFSGWTTNDITIDEDDTSFVMPNHDVTMTGSFTEAKYKVTYEFYNTSLPSNSNSLLPSIGEYKPGTIVSLPTINNVNGYQFLGWNKENNFIMPNHDITIYGEWMENNGTIEPTITIEIVEPKEVYRYGDIVDFKITVTNNNDFAINDVIVKENNDNAAFTLNDDYIVQSQHYAKLTSLSANASKIFYSTYKVLKSDYGTITNEIELVGGLTNNHRILSNIYKSSASFNVMSNLTVHYYLKDTTTKVHDDIVSEATFGSTYETSSIDSSLLNDEYRNKYHVVSNSNNVSGIISSNNVEVTYYYALEMYNVSTTVIGGVGNVTGSETIIGGNDSKEDVVITPSSGYKINKILINGQEVVITNKDEMTLDKFHNVREDKNIEVEFIEKDQPTPITGVTVKIYLVINIIVTLAFIFYCLYKKYTSKKENGGML